MRCWSAFVAMLQRSCLPCHLSEHSCTLCRLAFSALWAYPCIRQWWAHLRMLGPCWMVWWPTTSAGKLLQLAARTHAPDVLHLVHRNQEWPPVTDSACHKYILHPGPPSLTWAPVQSPAQWLRSSLPCTMMRATSDGQMLLMGLFFCMCKQCDAMTPYTAFGLGPCDVGW